MPIYVYHCDACGSDVEELQKLDADAPERASECPKGDAARCKLVRKMTSASHRFKAEASSDGLGGFQRQGDAIIRQVTGKNSTSYGSDRAGRE